MSTKEVARLRAVINDAFDMYTSDISESDVARCMWEKLGEAVTETEEKPSLRIAAQMVAENFTLYDSQINVVVPMDLIEKLQQAIQEDET